MELLDTRADVVVLNGDALVTVHGDLDAFAVPVLDAAVADAAAASRIVIDLEHVAFLDSAALRRIETLARELATDGRTLRVDHASGMVRRLIDIMRLDDLRVR